MARNTGSRALVYVATALKVGNSTTDIKYVFRSGLPSNLRNDFGQTLVTANINVTGAIFEANNFKPARGNRFNTTTKSYDGSYCADSKIASLKDAGVSVSKKKFKPYANSGRAKADLYFVTINGLKIGYRVIAPAGGLPTDLITATGLTKATSNDLIIMGSTFPKLGQAIYIDPSTGVASTYACDPAKYDNLSGNWSQGEPPLSTQADLVTLLGI